MDGCRTEEKEEEPGRAKFTRRVYVPELEMSIHKATAMARLQSKIVGSADRRKRYMD